MPDRTRNDNGRYRQKRSDTRVDTVEEIYGVDFGVRGDMRLGTLLYQQNADSLSKLLENTLPKSE
jgi:hypothetical protein